MNFTAEQQDAINAMRPLVCVSAGAGSGKTSILVERIAHLLACPEFWPDNDPQLERIAAITFTEKAAAEMKARLRAKFRGKPVQDDPAGMRFWREMERQVEGAHITTIHAFCSSILREHALRIGMDPEWAVPGDAESARLAEQAALETLYKLLEANDPAAQRVSRQLSRNELKQALSQALTLRLQLTAGTNPEHYTSPDKLQRFWEAQLPGLLESYIQSLHASPELVAIHEALRAYEGHCQDNTDNFERRRRAYQGLLESIQARTPGMAQRIAEVVAEHKNARAKKPNWSPEAKEVVHEALKQAKQFFEDHCMFPRTTPAFEQAVAEVTCDLYTVGRAVLAAYTGMRRERALMDFEDMIDITLLLLRDNDSLRERIAQGIRFLLIDEFQDTDARQLEIARLLCQSKGGPDLFIVGDAKQSIYFFRGAEVGLFRDMLRRDKAHIQLSTNFRSVPDVLRFVNDFFERSGLLGAVEQYQPMAAARQPLDTARIEIFAPRDADPDKRDSGPVCREREALFVARRIREMCDADAPLLLGAGTDSERPAAYDDIVLLFRRSSYMHSYEAALRDAGIPFNRIAGAGFFNRREVLDILSMLELIQDPWDEDALLTMLRSPLVGLSDESLLRMAQWAGGLAAAFHRDDMPACFDQVEALANGRALFADFYGCRELPPGALLRHILERSRYEAVLLSQYLGLQKVSNLRKMVQMADDFGHAQAASAAEFVRYLQDASVRDIREGEAMLQARGMGAVTLMTIHKAKGLEFPVVFIPEMYAGAQSGRRQILSCHPELGPVAKAPDEKGSLAGGAAGQMISRFRTRSEREEGARVLYVAMTRACDFLVLCGHANPGKRSWAETLNQCFDLDDYDYGDILAGDGWQAVIHRDVLPPPRVEETAVVQETPDPALVATMIAPATAVQTRRETISISRLLALMADAGEMAVTDIKTDTEDITHITEDGLHMSPSRVFAMTRGNLVHRMFELWDFSTDTPPDLDGLIQTAQLGLQQHARTKTHLEQMIARLRASEHWSCFAGAEHILREVPFLLDIGPVLVRGVIDAVLDENIIVDYKTGKPDSAFRRRFETQLLLYAAALRALRGHAPETGILWYADYGVAHQVSITHTIIEKALEHARSLFRAQ